MATLLVMPNYRLVFMVVSQAETAYSICQLPACNFGTQLKTDRSRECISSKCLLILEDFRADVKLLPGNGQGEAEE